MAIYRIYTPKKVTKRILKLPKKVGSRIINHLDDITHNPFLGIKLHGELNQYYKLRIGDYRVIYSINQAKKQVNILKIEHRQGVYK